MQNEKIPNPKELEKEISEFLSKKFGSQVKIINPVVLPEKAACDTGGGPAKNAKRISFDMRPQELIAYLDRYIVKQDAAKSILATKICTHFNRIKRTQEHPDESCDMVGTIKNNVLMMGPTGVGKTYMVRLIANKIGVPFVKGDATKFSETGYVGGDVEDLVRDLVREADDDIDLAQYGIVYIDEIDKIASSKNLIGADVSRTGVQRALLKPMEETEVDLKVPHDPIAMFQELENYRKTGKRERRTVNTKNILFIMSGAFADLEPIIKRRIQKKTIGFGADILSSQQQNDLLPRVKSEDLIGYGFETEFVGRLPVRSVFERLTEEDLYDILKNPNNPIVLGKKLDFAAYGIALKIDDEALRLLASRAYDENTGARGLVSAVEEALLPFEKSLPSSSVQRLPLTLEMINDPGRALADLIDTRLTEDIRQRFERLEEDEKAFIQKYIVDNRTRLVEKLNLALTPSRMEIAAVYYTKHAMDVTSVLQKIKDYYDEIKSLELYFFKAHDINIVFEESAVDYIIAKVISGNVRLLEFYQKLSDDLEFGLKLVQERMGVNRFFISRKALTHPEEYIAGLLKNDTRPAAGSE